MRNFLRNLILSEDEQKQLKSKKTFHIKPIGSSGTENYAGYNYEEYLQDLRDTERADIFDKMKRSDTQVVMNLSAVKNPIKSAKWSIRNPDPDDEKLELMTEFVEHNVFHEMENPFSKFLREALTMIEHGHSVFEMTHKVVFNHAKFGTYNGIKSLDWRSPRTIERWNLDPDTGRLKSIDQYAYGDLDRLVNIPAEFLVLFTVNVEGSNYEGISMLRPCYGSWMRKQEYLKLNAIGIEKHAVPIPVVKIPTGFSGQEGYDGLIESLENYVVHENNYLIHPEGVEINLQTNTYDPEKVETSINNEDLRMTKAFLANFLELGTGGSGGAYALSNDLSDFFLQGIEYLATEISEKFNRGVIKPLIDMNYGKQEKYPELVFTGIADKAGKEFSAMLNELTKSKVIKPDQELEDFVRDKMSLPKASLNDQRDVDSGGMFNLSEKHEGVYHRIMRELSRE